MISYFKTDRFIEVSAIYQHNYSLIKFANKAFNYKNALTRYQQIGDYSYAEDGNRNSYTKILGMGDIDATIVK